ncbi:ABC transporter substrate-binding protein [Saccharothrix longispora]|uniref:ABC transporter substrate-binding protein n=1 Tax=Saccharothrix longispora TaxID=33920 RepID=UPI0028FDA9CD|nr:ABC transporter substrate-binding protein [Saccharothrix longispora]MBY8848104.1 ABC transporter substrate-binding protein [Saccharothrix sp. MB29]MDU0289267.1 ABC transporter substrate-binding protein [Saccharothrix longispora]
MRILMAILLLSASLAGCAVSTAPARVIVLGPWTGLQEERFEQVLALFEDARRIDVEYIGTTAPDQVLRADVQKGTPPHVAVLPSPGDLAAYVGDGYVTPLGGVVAVRSDEYPRRWADLEELASGERYAVVVKADLKSVVWHPADVPVTPPTTKAELLALTAAEVAAGRTPWCLRVAAQTNAGWPGTDWVEDVVLHEAGPDVYRRWAAAEQPWNEGPVRQAWRTWGELIGGGAVRGGLRATLLTNYDDPSQPMFDTPRGCLLDHQAPYVTGVYSAGEADFFPFPSLGAPEPAAEVSADLAALFRDTPEARALMDFLASTEAQRTWPAAGGAYSVNQSVGLEVYGSEVERRVAAELVSEGRLCFDASDLMPAPLRTAFHRAVLRYLDDPDDLQAVLDTLEGVRRQVSEEKAGLLDLPC